MRLVLLLECCGEVFADDGHEAGSHIATMGDTADDPVGREVGGVGVRVLLVDFGGLCEGHFGRVYNVMRWRILEMDIRAPLGRNSLLYHRSHCRLYYYQRVCDLQCDS